LTANTVSVPSCVAVRSHYNVLGVAQDADDATIRAAYRQLARDHHPDRVRSSSAAGGRDMPAINEAYRVLYDPGRRAVYDRSLAGRATATGPQTGSSSTGNAHGDGFSQQNERWDVGGPDLLRPARVPWRSLLLFCSVAIIGILVLAQFSGVGNEVGPDGILRNGDCVEIQVNGDAREVSCAGELDLVVRAFIPFDGTCPGGTEPHRDRQGMGVACVKRPD
jgi:molecular chaperone DnaJ